MALYDTRFGLPQSMVDYLNQGLPSIYQSPTVDLIDSQPILEDEDDQVLEQLYPQNYQSGGDGYSVYNPDPNMTRTFKNYNPRPAYEAAFGTMMGDPVANIATGALNKFDVMGSYREKPPSGLETLFNKYVKNSPLINILGSGMKAIGGMLPVNRTGIMQNELLGAGFALDNIGRIVAAPGKYNTPEGIMAGYNLAAREQDFDDPKNVFNKRDTNIRNTLKNKYGLNDQQIDQALSEIEEEGEYTGPFGYNETLGKTTNLFENLFNINKARNIVKDRQKAADIIFNRKLKERREEKQRAAVQEAARKSAIAQEAANRDAARKKSSGPSYSGMSSIGSGGGGGKDTGGAASRGGGSSYGTKSESGWESSPF
jgi:uncharacterized membrane protein YgcG